MLPGLSLETLFVNSFNKANFFFSRFFILRIRICSFEGIFNTFLNQAGDASVYVNKVNNQVAK